MVRNEHLPFYIRAAARAGARQEKVSYPWVFFYVRRPFALGFLTTGAVCGGAFLFYLWYVRTGHEATARSPFGIAYGLIGTGFLAAAAVGFSVRRRQSTREVGQLNGALQWHIFFAITGSLILVMHSFDHLQHLSGAAALLCLLLLVLSGVIGKLLDHLLPRQLAAEVANALAENGENWGPAFSQSRKMTPEKRATRARWGLPPPVLQDMVQGSVRAVKREQVYRSVLYYWRIIHIALGVITVGVSCWHIVYAVQVVPGW